MSMPCALIGQPRRFGAARCGGGSTRKLRNLQGVFGLILLWQLKATRRALVPRGIPPDSTKERLGYVRGWQPRGHIVENPITCPVAGPEFAFLSDRDFSKRGVRDKMDITYVTPLDSAFTKETCAKALTHLVTEESVRQATDFNAGSVDGPNGCLVSAGPAPFPGQFARRVCRNPVTGVG